MRDLKVQIPVKGVDGCKPVVLCAGGIAAGILKPLQEIFYQMPVNDI